MDDELDTYLASLERSSKFNVIRTLKATPHETTELVTLADGISAPGPYIRKRIALDAGIGQTYPRLFEEQQAGRHATCSPHIYECYETEDCLTVVMEFVQGKTLADWVYEADPSSAFAAYVFPLICNAVSELHEGFEPPIIHRDLKPSNVMINEQGVRVIDFGIARSYRKDAESDTRHFGTPSYAPPEQFGFGQTDERSDIYALGMLLYYCLTERTPTFSMLESEFEDDDVPVPLRKVIAKATSFDPANRYASVRGLKQAFLKAIDETLALVPANAADWAPPSGMPALFATEQTAAATISPVRRQMEDGRESGIERPPNCSVPGNCLPTQADTSSNGLTSQINVFDTGHMPQVAVPYTNHTLRRVQVHKALAIAWNIVVLFAWLMMIGGCFFAAFEPNETNVLAPTWVLVLEYPVLMGGFFTFVAYALLYKKFLRRTMPALAPFSVRKSLVICAVGAILCFAAAVGVQAIWQAII